MTSVMQVSPLAVLAQMRSLFCVSALTVLCDMPCSVVR